MCSKGIIKRALPFFAALITGLFIASFFVDIAPRFQNRGPGRRYHEMKRLRMDYEQLKEENLRLRNELENRTPGTRVQILRSNGNDWDLSDLNAPVPPTPPVAPLPPARPKAAR